MIDAQLTFREAPELSPGSRVYRVACRHGVSSAALIPGSKPISDATVFDLVLPGHNRRHSCSCQPYPDRSVPAPIGTEGDLQ